MTRFDVSRYHLAQLNIVKMKHPMDDSRLNGLFERMEDINALADVAPGFAWRLRIDDVYSVLWWVDAAHPTSLEEADARLDHLRLHGPNAFAFTFKHSFPPG